MWKSYLGAPNRHNLLTLWTNFAKYGGDPTPKESNSKVKWGPVRTGQYSVHLEFTPEGKVQMETDDGDYKRSRDKFRTERRGQ